MTENSKPLVAMIGTGLNFSGWDHIVALFEAFGCECLVVTGHEEAPERCTLGLLVCCDRIVPEEVLRSAERGFVLTHSSPLPIGRGFAPIYNTAAAERDLVVSLLHAAPQVDAGNLILQASYRLDHNEVESELRRVDDMLTLRLFAEAGPALLAGTIPGAEQDHSQATWHERRRPAQSEIDTDRSVASLFNHLRGIPASAPAFFTYRGRQFTLSLKPVEDLEIEPDRVSIKRFY